MSKRRSQDFRNIYANAITFGMSDHDAKFVFGISDMEAEPEEQVSINVTHSTLKIMALILADAVASYERDNGPIIVAPEKLQDLEDQVAANAATADPKAD